MENWNRVYLVFVLRKKMEVDKGAKKDRIVALCGLKTYLKIIVIIMLITKSKTEIVFQYSYLCFGYGVFLFFH